MTQFDEILRQGLMEANLAQYGTLLDRLPDWAPDFSPRYRRERMRLLADPWSWVKRRERPVWKRAARNIACVLLACTVAFGALMAASPTVRASVFGWLRTLTRNEAYYEGPTGNFKVYQEQPDWRPTWLPEGFRFAGVSITGGNKQRFADAPAGWEYRLSYNYNGNENYPDTPYLMFICNHSRGSHIGLGLLDDTTIQTATVWGREADFYDRGNYTELIWNGPGGELFQLSAFLLDKETLEKVADSVQEVDAQPMPEYRPGWMPELAPEGRARPTSSTKDEMAQFSFQLKDLSFGTVLYAAKSMGPLWTPNRTPEAVEVNGAPAQYWAAEEMDDGVSWANTFTSHETGETEVVSRSIGSVHMSTLIWTDPETEISFAIQATSLLSKEDFIKIAENLTADGG